MESKREEKIGEALLKVALGYQIAEVTEEYAEVDGVLKLTKRKKTKKDVPPDLKAVQMLLEQHGDSAEYSSWSDEDLEREKERLIGLLQSGLETKKVGDGCETSTVVGGDVGENDGVLAGETAPKKSVRRRSVIKKTVVKKSVATRATVNKKRTK